MNYNLKDGRVVELREVKVTDATLLLLYFEKVNLESKFLIREAGEFTFTVNDERKFIRRTLKSNNEHISVAFLGDELIGSIGFRSSHLKRITHRASLGMSVLKDYNNLGLGSIMMEYILKIAKETGKLKMELEVRSENVNAIHLYEKFGFEHEGRIKKGFFVDNEYLDLLKMGKWL